MTEKIDMTQIQIRGPAIDALNERKESDNGPTEDQVTKDGAAHFKKFGPPKWSDDVIRKVYEMGRERS